MEPFVNVFFAIDKDQSEQITTDELKKYVSDNHLDESMVTRWQTLFDPDNSGIITLEKFCDVLGLKPEQARSIRETSQSSSQSLSPDVEVIFADMSLENQIKISEQTLRLTLPPSELDEKNITVKLKEWLDKIYGPTWNVCISDGSHWITYSHLESHSFQFRLKGKTYMIWRSHCM